MIDPTGHEVSPPNPDPEPLEDSNVCDTCFGDNLLKEVGIVKCAKCEVPFCLHYASKIDPQYCVDCMDDMKMTKEEISKTYEHYNEVTDQYRRYSRKCRQIKIEGQAWLFAQRKVKSLTDAELEMVIEYHRTFLQLLLTESEERKMARLHRYSQVKVTAVPSTTSTVTTTTTVKKVTETKSVKAKEQLAAVLNSLLAKGLTAEQIAEMARGGS